MDCPHLIFHTHSTSRYSVAALLGAVEADHRLAEMQVSAPLEVSFEDIQSSLERGPVVLAHSVMSTQTERVYQSCREVRDRFGNNVILVAGGPHASARPRELLEVGFDYVVVGEGERAFTDLLRSLMNEKDPSGIEGIVSRDSESCPCPAELPKVTLDDYPPFALRMNILGPVEVTRGCPFTCRFCSTPFLTGGRVRHRSISSIVHWLERAVRERGFRRTWFLSPNALSYGGRGRSAALDKLESLLRQSTSIDGLEEVFFGSFPSEVRPEFVTRENLEMMRQYVANETLQIGLQSASDRVLKIANRHHTVEQGLKAIDLAFECGFVPHVDMIFGLPGETQKELMSSIEMCQTLAAMGARIHGHVFMPLPGSAFENESPRRLDEGSRSLLGELSRKGVLTGSWSNQEVLADRLSVETD